MIRYILFSLLWGLFFIILPYRLPAQQPVDRHTYDLLLRAQKNLDNDNPAAALTQLAPLLRAQKPSSYALCYAAVAHGLLEHYDQAVTLWQQGVTLYPEQRNLWYNLGLSHMRVETPAKARDAFKQVLLLDRQQKTFHPEPFYHLAFAYYRLEQFTQAETTIKQITTHQPPKKHWLHLQLYSQIAQQKWKSATATGQQLLSLDPADSAIWQLMGQIAVNNRQHKEGLVYTEIAQAASPSKNNTRLLSQLYGAEYIFSEQARMETRDHPSHISHVRHLMRAYQFDQALAELARLTTMYGPTMEGRLLQAEIHAISGKPNQAIALLQDTRQLAPTFPDPARKTRHSLKQIRQAQDKLRARILLLRGQLHWQQRQWQQARDVYKQLELLPGQQTTGRMLAQCMQTLLEELHRPVPLPEILDPPLAIHSLL